MINFNNQSSNSNLSVSSTAKILGIGSITLFRKLREMKILGSDNLPYQRYIDQGYFTVTQKDIKGMRGNLKWIQPVTLVTAKGVKYLQNLLQKGSGLNDGWDDDDSETSFSITIQLK
jgi:anti-repressor protein